MSLIRNRLEGAAPERVVVFSPHADDEILGVGGTTLLLKQVSPKTEVVFVLVCCSDCWFHHLDRVVSASELADEFRASCKQLGADEAVIWDFPYLNLDGVDMGGLVNRIDRCLELFQPTVILFPESGTHQDHMALNRAVKSSLRPTGLASPWLAMEYESPTGGTDASFHPTTFVDIETVLSEKIKIFAQSYATQYKNGGRSEDEIRHHAAFRGLQARIQHAEAFNVVRAVL